MARETFEGGSWLERNLGLRPGERAVALVLMLTGALLIAGSTIAKSIRDSLFLDAYSVERLPLVLIAIAVLTAPIVSLYTHLSNRVPFRILAPGFYMIVAIGFMIMERLYALGHDWAAIALYLYVNLLGLFGVSQFWLLVGWRFHGSYQTRRLIGMLGAGTVFGGLMGGLLARSLSRMINAEAILWIVAGLYAGAGLTTDWVTRQHQDSSGPLGPQPVRQSGMIEGLRQVSRHALLRGIVVVLLLVVLIGALTEYQFKFEAQSTYPPSSADSKTNLVRYFSSFYAIIGVVQLVLQLLVTQYVMRRWGVAGGLLLLPLGMLPGCAAMLFAPGLAAATILRGGEQAIRNSSYRSGFEILYLPLPPELRRQTKPVIDVLLERIADGLAGVILIVLTSGLDLGSWGLTVLTLSLILALILVVLRLRRSYISTLEKNLSVAVDAFLTDTPVVDHATLQTLEIPTLPAQDARILQSLEVSSRLAPLKGMPLELLKHPSPPIRERAMAMLEAFGSGKTPSAVEIEQLRTDALAARQEPWIPAAPAAAISTPLRPLAAGQALELTEVFSRLVKGKGLELLEALVQAERLDDVRLAHAVIPLLEDRRLRDRAEAVLRRSGRSIAGLLGDVLLDEEQNVRTRRHVARLLGEVDSPLAELALKRGLLAQAGDVRRAASTALYIMRSRGFSRGLEPDELHELLEPEVRRNLSVWEADTELQRTPTGAPSSPRRDALALSLRETKNRTLRHVFRLLGLCFPPEAIQAAYKGLTAGSTQVRDQALEYLDNVLPEKLRQLVWPLMDPESRWGDRPRQRDLEHIMMDLLRSGVTIDLPREALDLSMEPTSEE